MILSPNNHRGDGARSAEVKHFSYKRFVIGVFVWMLVMLISTKPVAAQNQVMGELGFEGKTKVERDSGVWIDGNYVGYLKELNGSKKIMLLPGAHEVIVRQSGYSQSDLPFFWMENLSGTREILAGRSSP